jgi:hypothetical protein
LLIFEKGSKSDKGFFRLLPIIQIKACYYKKDKLIQKSIHILKFKWIINQILRYNYIKNLMKFKNLIGNSIYQQSKVNIWVYLSWSDAISMIKKYSTNYKWYQNQWFQVIEKIFTSKIIINTISQTCKYKIIFLSENNDCKIFKLENYRS